MSQKVGVFLPTYARPDLLRRAALLWAAQDRQPDLICVFQNGTVDSCEDAIDDLRDQVRIDWMHDPGTLTQMEWYRRPLQYLLDAGCTHFFWGDHDDIMLRHHVSTRLRELQSCDYIVGDNAGLLFLSDGDFRFQPSVYFRSHAVQGMSSSMAFTRSFALSLEEDFRVNATRYYADEIVRDFTMPRFNCAVSRERTAIYVSHMGSVSSAKWVDKSSEDYCFPENHLQ
jgi:hypothetical protein